MQLRLLAPSGGSASSWGSLLTFWMMQGRSREVVVDYDTRGPSALILSFKTSFSLALGLQVSFHPPSGGHSGRSEPIHSQDPNMGQSWPDQHWVGGAGIRGQEGKAQQLWGEVDQGPRMQPPSAS